MATLARDLPDVRDFAVWNEPNLNGFWLYQFDESGNDIAARAYTSLLARSYDALKGVSPKIRVYGGSLAPRGADNPESSRHTQSPSAFIRDMGDAYRGERAGQADHGRLRDPSVPRALLGTPPSQAASAGNGHRHRRLRQARPTPRERLRRHSAGGLEAADRLHGVRRPGEDPQERPGAPTRTSTPPSGQDAVDEATQARYYRQALELAACQPTVIALFFFHLIDEPDLDRWQSGPYYVDTKPKSSLPAIREAAEKARKGKLATCS